MYHGPISLAASKHASPVGKAGFAAFPSTAQAASPKRLSASNTIATKEQIVAVTDSPAIPEDMASYNADAQLAMAQNEALKEEVEKYTTTFTKSVSIAVTNTRQLLNLIRDSIKKDSPTAGSELSTIDKLWEELERLFEAAKEAKASLPKFIEKQKENMSLYHSSMINETIRDTQEELNLQHKKVNIQHSLILEHQQSFQDYKTQTDLKLKELNELQERVSRLTLDKGLLRTELDKYMNLFHEAKASNATVAETIRDLRKELHNLKEMKKELGDENETLKSTVSGLQEKLTAAEHRITDEYEKDIHRLNEVLGKEAQKQAGLQSLIKNLQSGGSTVKKESEKLKAEFKGLQEKFKNQGEEFSRTFSQLNDQNKRVASLTKEIADAKGERTDLRNRLEKFDELQKTHSQLLDSKTKLEEEVGTTTHRLGELEKQLKIAKGEVRSFTEKLTTLERENSDLRTKLAEKERNAATLASMIEENAKLRASVQAAQLKKTSQVTRDEFQALEAKLRENDHEKEKLEAAVKEWKSLATKSYQEYKQILPLYKKAEEYQEACVDKDKVISTLQEELQKANGATTVDDTVYWKEKYETLLATLG